MESDNSANAGSKASRGALDRLPEAFFAESWREDLDEGRRGVVGRERGRRGAEVDLFALLPPAWGVVEAIFFCLGFSIMGIWQRSGVDCGILNLLIGFPCCRLEICTILATGYRASFDAKTN
jgi:hypothetical protein